jgi:hypothetical protein
MAGHHVSIVSPNGVDRDLPLEAIATNTAMARTPSVHALSQPLMTTTTSEAALAIRLTVLTVRFKGSQRLSHTAARNVRRRLAGQCLKALPNLVRRNQKYGVTGKPGRVGAYPFRYEISPDSANMFSMT